MPLVQWWCSARGTTWSWAWQAYPGVWLFVALAAVLGHRLLISRDAPSARWRRGAWVAGLVMLWLTLDWPVGPLGAGYLSSVHAVQFISLAMIVSPLLLLGVDRERVARALERSTARAHLVRAVTSPLPLLVVFAIVMVTTHIPTVVDALMRTQVGAFALDAAWLISGLAFWWPVIVRVPERPRFGAPLRMLYVFFGTQVHLFIGMWLMISPFPVYATYELAPRASRLTAIIDQQVAAAVMIGVTGPLVLGIISVIFFRWAARNA